MFTQIRITFWTIASITIIGMTIILIMKYTLEFDEQGHIIYNKVPLSLNGIPVHVYGFNVN